MKRTSAGHLADFIDTYQERTVGRVTTAQFFQGTVVTLTGSPGSYQCTVQRTSETAADGNSYAVLNLSPVPFVPSVGQVVECCWRDQWTAWVLGPVATAASMPYRCRVYGTGNQALGASFAANTVVFDAENTDPNSNFDTTTYTWTCPVAGDYAIESRISVSTSANRCIYAVFLNGTETRRGSDYSSSSSPTGCQVACELALVAGDLIKMNIAVNSSVGSPALENGASLRYLDIRMVRAA